MIIAVILCPPDLVLLVRSGPVIRDSGGSVRIWGDNGPVLISYFYDGAVPVKVFQNRSQSDFYMDNVIYKDRTSQAKRQHAPQIKTFLFSVAGNRAFPGIYSL